MSFEIRYSWFDIRYWISQKASGKAEALPYEGRFGLSEEKVQKRKGIVHINHAYCKCCSICVDFCPVKNLEIRQQKLVELERCIACKTCQRYCPDMAIEIEEIDAKTVVTG